METNGTAAGAPGAGGVRRVADLKLRGPAGRMPVRVRWPSSTPSDAPPPLILVLPDAAPADGVDQADDDLARELCSRVGAVVLCTPWAPRQPGALDRAEATLLWVAEHGGELAADPTRLAVVGRGAGALAAAVLALRARDRGWPRLERQVLVVAEADTRAARRSESAPASGGTPAPAILVTPGAGHADCSGRWADWLRATGVEVERLTCGSPPAASDSAGLGASLLADMTTSLRGALS